MVTQNTLHTRGGKQLFFEEKKTRFDSTYAPPISELSSNISTMIMYEL